MILKIKATWIFVVQLVLIIISNSFVQVNMKKENSIDLIHLTKQSKSLTNYFYTSILSLDHVLNLSTVYIFKIYYLLETIQSCCIGIKTN